MSTLAGSSAVLTEAEARSNQPLALRKVKKALEQRLGSLAPRPAAATTFNSILIGAKSEAAANRPMDFGERGPTDLLAFCIMAACTAARAAPVATQVDCSSTRAPKPGPP